MSLINSLAGANMDIDVVVDPDGIEGETWLTSSRDATPHSFAGSSTLPETSPSVTPYTMGTSGDSTSDTRTERKRNGGRRMSYDRGHPYARPSYQNDHNYRNDSDSNETYNSSQIHERDCHGGVPNSMVTEAILDEPDQYVPYAVQGAHTNLRRKSTSPPNPHAAPLSPKEATPQPLPTSPAAFFETKILPQPRTAEDIDRERSRTRSRSYELLLLRSALGCPLWMPSPRCTSGGVYMAEIGDVGFLSHGLPFNTLFNITQPRTSLSNRDGIPEGVEPPCPLESRDVMIQEKYHPTQTTLFQPKGAISKQAIKPPGVISELLSPLYTIAYYTLNLHLGTTPSHFTYHMSAKEGALLMLPHGSTLHNLNDTANFMERALLHWRQWYDFADGQVDPDNGQALYLVTGVERCTTWAMAAWDSISSCGRDDLGSLKLTIDGITRVCKWALPPVRCTTKASEPLATNSSHSNQETVFIRGFWIDRLNGKLSPSISPSGPPKETDRSGYESPDSRRGSPKQPPFSDPSFKQTSSTHSSFPNDQDPEVSHAPSDLNPEMIEALIWNLDLDFLDEGEDELVTRPCRVINRFALKLLSKAKPALMDTGCAAFSHDDDWISIIQDSDEGIPPQSEIIRRICSKFKFTIAGDVIYTASMTYSEKQIFEQREASHLQKQSRKLSVLVVSVEDNSAINKSHQSGSTEAGPELGLPRPAVDNS
ncbi:hypothetical protein PM082_015709 [Marasmius tenuissimus]|nr:hypothetical protein PM082_015709 [Marasmius tenuissimus]